MNCRQSVLFETAAPPAETLAHQRWWRLLARARNTGRAVEPLLVTPRFVRQLQAQACPVSRQRLGSDCVVAPLRADADYAAGHLALLSRVAAEAPQGGWAAAWAEADRLAAAGGTASGLDAPAWRRLAVLRSFVQPLTPAAAAMLPLLVLPPNRVRVLSAVQGLQVALTLTLLAPQRARRLCAVAGLAACEETRQAARGFVLTLLARAPAGLDAIAPAARRHALEDLWTDALLARRWQRLALRLDDTQAARWLGEGRQRRWIGAGWRILDDRFAVDGWFDALESPDDRARPLAGGVLAAGRGRDGADAPPAPAACH